MHNFSPQISFSRENNLSPRQHFSHIFCNTPRRQQVFPNDFVHPTLEHLRKWWFFLDDDKPILFNYFCPQFWMTTPIPIAKKIVDLVKMPIFLQLAFQTGLPEQKLQARHGQERATVGTTQGLQSLRSLGALEWR